MGKCALKGCAIARRGADPPRPEAVIEEANAAAGDLLGVPSALLVRKPLHAYLNIEARVPLEDVLTALEQRGGRQADSAPAILRRCQSVLSTHEVSQSEALYLVSSLHVLTSELRQKNYQEF